MDPKELDGMVVDDEDSNLYAEIQANEAEGRQDSITEKDYDCLDFYRYDGLCLASITARPRPMQFCHFWLVLRRMDAVGCFMPINFA